MSKRIAGINMSWYAFKGYNNNKAINASSFDGAELNLLGMHGYPTQAEAEAKPNAVNIFQATFVNAAIDDANNARDVASAPGNAAKAAGKAAANAAKGIPGISSVTDFLGGLTSANLWIRIAKGIIGGALILLGAAKLTGIDNKVANAAVKAAPLL